MSQTTEIPMFKPSTLKTKRFKKFNIKKFEQFCDDVVNGKKNTHAKMFFTMFKITETHIFRIFTPQKG